MKTKQTMEKFLNSIYAVNESLLDSVENDEVKDDEDSGLDSLVEYRFMFHFESSMGATAVKSMFFGTCMEPTLCRLKNMGLVDSWKFIKKLGKLDDFPNIDFYSNYMYGTDAKKKFKNSNVLSVDVSILKESETADGIVIIAAYMMQSVMACRICVDSGISIRMAFWKTGDDNVCSVFCVDRMKWVFHCGQKGYNLSKGCVKFAGSFIRTARGMGFIEPVDDAGSRYVAYGFSRMAPQNRMYMFDSSGGLLFEREAYIKESTFGRFDENGLMQVKFMNFNRNMNFLKMDGTFLLDYMFDECEDSFSEGFISIRIRNQYGAVMAKLIDKEGNSLLGDWTIGAENFVDGLSVITRYDDKRDICNSNIIDRSGKPILDEWYEYVVFEDSANKKKRIENQNRKRDVANVCRFNRQSLYWESNYVDRTGKLFFKEWFNGHCSCMVNGFASVCRDEYGTKTYNYIRADRSFVSKEWFDEVCGWPECGMFAFKSSSDEWRFMDTDTGKVVLDEYKFGKLEATEADDGAKMYHVDHIYLQENGTWKFLGYQDGYSMKTFQNMVSADGKMCCGMTDASRIQYVGNGFASVLLRSGDTVLWKWGAGPVDLGKSVSFVNKFDECGYATVVSSGDMKENIIDKDGNLVSDVWFDGIGVYMKSGFVAVKNNDVTDVLVCKTGKCLFGKSGSGLSVNMLYDVVPDELVVVECLEENGYKYNLFDADGKQLLDKWTEFRIELDKSGLLKVGPCSYVDHSGKIAGLI